MITKADLTVPFCEAEWREGPRSRVGVRYACGMSLSGKEMDAMTQGNIGAFNAVHERHHTGDHTDNPWSVKTTTHADGTVSLRCSCKGA